MPLQNVPVWVLLFVVALLNDRTMNICLTHKQPGCVAIASNYHQFVFAVLSHTISPRTLTTEHTIIN